MQATSRHLNANAGRWPFPVPKWRMRICDVFYVGVLRETTGGEQFSHAVLPIDSERALRTAGVLIIFVADLD